MSVKLRPEGILPSGTGGAAQGRKEPGVPMGRFFFFARRVRRKLEPEFV
jgi:hypothetical protein